MGLSDYLKSLDKYEDRGQVDPPVETCLPTLVLHPQENFRRSCCILWCGGGGGLIAKSCLTLETLWIVAHQASLSRGFSRQEDWSGFPCPSPGESSPPKDQTQVSCIAGDPSMTELLVILNNVETKDPATYCISVDSCNCQTCPGF